jgi:hypothetical protein
MTARIYVGYTHNDKREVFKSEIEPTQQTHGDIYFAAWGPFRTMRGANFGASNMARNNPHTLTVSDCERIAKQVSLTS